MANAKRDKNNKPSIQGLHGNELKNILVEEDGRLVMAQGVKNTTYTDKSEKSVLDDNGSPSLIGVTPSGHIRRLKTDSQGRLLFVQK